MRLFCFGVLILAVLLPSTVLFWEARDAPHLGYFQDDSLYVAAAKSLAEGHGYRIPSLPGQPYQTKYPPLFPALLALIWKLDSSFPANLFWIMLLQWLLWLFYLAAVSLVVWSMPVLQRQTKMAVLIFVAMAPAFVFLSLSIMSETLLAAFVSLTIWLVGLDCRPSPRIAFLAGLCASAAYLGKTAALPLLLAVPLGLLWRKRYKAAAWFALPPLATVIVWTSWVAAHSSRSADLNLLYYTNYIGFYMQTVSIADLPLIFSTNLSALVQNIGQLILFSPPQTGALIKIIHIVIGLLVLLSTGSLLMQLRAPALRLFAVLYVAECLLWNYQPNERFLFPVLFLLVAGFFHGLRKLLGRVTPARLAMGLWTGGVVLLVGWSLSQTSSYVSNLLPALRRGQDRLACVARWVDRNIPPDRQILAYRDVDLFLYSGRRGIRMVPLPPPYFRSDRAEAEKVIWNMPAYANRAGMDYLLWDRDDYRIDPFLDDERRREEILNGLRGVVLEREICGVRIYRFTR
jgi:hypothetical protein